MVVIDSQMHTYMRDCVAYPWPAETSANVERATQWRMTWREAEPAEHLMSEMDKIGVVAVAPSNDES